MKLLTLLIATVTLCAVPAGITGAPSSPVGDYIIKLKPGVSQDDFRHGILEKSPQFGPNSSNKLKHQYHHAILNGFSGSFTQAFIASLLKDHGSSIEYVVPDGVATIMDETQTSPPSWGLTRVSQHQLALTSPFVFPNGAGKGVSVYVVDTGIQANQTDFGGRAKFVKSFVTGEEDTDLNGHGTHCSGTIGSKTYGVAKYANIFGVKVLNGQGTGTWSDVIAGISFAATDTSNGSGPRVISMSLGGGQNQAVNDAATNAYKAGVNVIVAAGNNYAQDACTLSPAGATGAFAVAGVAATFLSVGSYANPDALYAALQKAATSGVVQGLTTATANLLLYNHPA
jgi:subtilisin family serine protease